MVFDKNWFKKHQKGLLFLLNNPILKYWFRWVMRIHKDLSYKERICEIEPNNYKVKISENKYRADFRTHNKFSKRLYFAFKPFWYLLHYLDLVFFDKYELKFSFGFSTLTVYPDAGTGATTVDGIMYRLITNTTWADLHDNDATTVQPSDTGPSVVYIGSATTSWEAIARALYGFNTSSIGAGSTITAATMSLYGVTKKNEFASIGIGMNIYYANPAVNNNMQLSDYNITNLGTTAYSTTISYAGWSITGYNNFVFNTTGINAIQKTGITNVSARDPNYDVPDIEPTWEASKQTYLTARYSEYTGTTQDPKLVVTYTTGTTTTNNIAGLL